MGTYYNPPQNLPQVARKLREGSYQDLVEQLLPGEKLFGHYDRFMFQNAVYLDSEREFYEFEEQVRKGIIKRLAFYALSEGEFEKIKGY